MDLQEVRWEGMDRKDVAQDRERGGFLQTRVPYNAANFLTS